ncbi:MaoC/PaaZ C-terminal domain-containing protein [Bordetella genomosp. 13]|uniref:MaoC/PaaZ C-terminal domain-containing protein n=1 Tax=Bordetella genomosp. 13 TaxID=463040 RepID=UPI0011A1989E|nr:MaoC/PaaZ C-terminal domain-containing protein [Bordetella genomosp. 13]
MPLETAGAVARQGPAWHVGWTFESAGRTITETDVVQFAGLSGDYNRLHVDHHYAADTRFGQRIAHGLLVLSVLSGLTTQTLEYRSLEPAVLALVDLNVRFPKPTFIGDTVHARVTVSEVRQEKPGRDRVVFLREAVNQRGEVVVQAAFAMLMRTEARA